MSGWDEYVACVETRDAQAANILRSGFLQAFDRNVEKAEAATKAIVDWWDGLDSRVRRAVSAAALVGGGAATIFLGKIAELIVTASGLLDLAVAGAEVALGLGAILAGFALGAFLMVTADCVGLIHLGFND